MRTVFLVSITYNGAHDVLAFESKTARDVAYSQLMRNAVDERRAGAEIILTKGEIETKTGPLPDIRARLLAEAEAASVDTTVH